MNALEIASLVSTLNEIQRIALTQKLSTKERDEWRLITLSLKLNGLGLKKERIRDPFTGRLMEVRWSAKPFDEIKRKNHQCDFVFTNMSPQRHLKGDCTTRSMSFLLRGEMTYEEIEREQYRRADEKNAEEGLSWGDRRAKWHRNTDGVWDTIMTERGYSWVELLEKKSVANVASFFRGRISYPFIVTSRKHATVIDNGVLRDTWDSRGSRVVKILVKSEDCEKAREILSEFGISTKM